MNLFDLLRRIRPAGALLTMVILGILSLLANFSAGTADVVYKGQQVGYASAVNWCFGFIVVVPLSIYFMLAAFRSADRLPAHLVKAHMVVAPDGTLLTGDLSLVERRWTELTRGASRWSTPLLVAGVAVNVWEWWTNSAHPLLLRDLPVERDWSVAALIPGNGATGHFLVNALISLMAFSLQTIYVLALLAFLLFVYAFSELIRELADRDIQPILILNVRSEDRRRGFQIFEGVVEQVLLAAAFGFTIFYLSRVWNLYLPSDKKTLWDYVLPDITSGFEKKEISAIAKRLLDIGGGLNYSGIMVIIGAVILFSLSVGIPLLLLRRAALEARESTTELIEGGATEFIAPLAPESALERARDLTVWPLGYPKANELLVLALIAICSIVLFRIGLFYLGLLILYLLKKGYKALK